MADCYRFLVGVVVCGGGMRVGVQCVVSYDGVCCVCVCVGVVVYCCVVLIPGWCWLALCVRGLYVVNWVWLLSLGV